MFKFVKDVHNSLNKFYEFLKALNRRNFFLSILLSSFLAGISLGVFSFTERTMLYGGGLSLVNKLKALCFSTGLLGLFGLGAGLIVCALAYILISAYIKLCELSQKDEKAQSYKVLILYSVFWAAIGTYLFIHFIIENPADALIDIFRINDLFIGGIYFLYAFLALIIIFSIIVFLQNSLKKGDNKKYSFIKSFWVKVSISILLIISVYYLLSLSLNSWQINQWISSKSIASYNTFWVSFLSAYSKNLILFKINFFLSLCAMFLVINYLFVYIVDFFFKQKASNLFASIFAFIIGIITYFQGQNLLTNQLFLRFQITLIIILFALISFVSFVISFFYLFNFVKKSYSITLKNSKLKSYLILSYILICIIGFWGYNSNNAVKVHICRYYTTERLVLYSYKLFDGNVFTSLIPPKISNLKKEHDKQASLKQSLKESPNIILIVIDALRKDVVSENLNTPNNVIGEFAQQAYTFDNFYSHTTYTVGSLSSLFSSKLFASRSDLDYTTLAEILSSNGYFTYAVNTFVKDFNFDYITINNKKYDALFSRGFERIDKVKFSINEAKTLKDKNITLTFNKFLKNYNHKKPLFAYIHFTEMHSIQPSAVLKNIFSGKNFYKRYNEIYQSENNNLARLMKVLKMHNLYDNSLIIITTDHGEAAKDHGNLFHVNSVYQELVNIPFYLKLPHQKKPISIKQSFSLLDLFPTILNYIGYDYSNFNIDGRSFYPALKGMKTPQKHVIVSEYVYKYPLAFEYGLYGNDDMYDKAIFEVGIIDKNAQWKVIKNYFYDFTELYNLKTDPKEKNNLIDEQQQIAEELLQKYNNPFFYKNN